MTPPLSDAPPALGPGSSTLLRRPHTPLAALLTLATALALSLVTRAADAPEALEFFETHIRPVLVDHCYPCHSATAEKLRGDLLLDTKEGWTRGGASGKPALLPGDPDHSLLLRAVRHSDPELAMPPKKKIPDEAIAALEAWIRQGAADPRTGPKPPPNPRELARTHWAFQPVRRVPPPAVAHEDWIQSPIDRFILRDLDRHGLTPSPRADRRTLIRRASLILTGLMPSATDVRNFESDASPQAFERVIDRLLASPRYGERWGRHWLDLARYADTKGYVFEEERRYPYSYTYRDYVVRALNDDKPYDQFLVEQLAADQFTSGEDRSALAALGFLTLGRRFLNNPHDIIDDRIDVLMRGTQALTVGCARCHDHKYDPIPSADYYSLYGVFASSHEPEEKPLIGAASDPLRFQAFQAELARREKERHDFVTTKVNEYRKRLRETVGDYLLAAHDAATLDDAKREELARSRQLSPFVVTRWLNALKGEGQLPEPLFGTWRRFAALDTSEFAARAATLVSASTPEAQAAPVARALLSGEPLTSLKQVAERYNRVFTEAAHDEIRHFLDATDSPIAISQDQVYRLFNVPDGQRKRALQRAVEELHATHPGAPPRAMALLDNAQPTEPVVFKRGNPGNPGPKVPRQFLELLAGPQRQPFTQGSGRLELARAIASPENPLTARVAVNRVWIQHFGAGLVRTPTDFGLRSEPPTHPELLDWLAREFMDDGWSLKRLHRRILLSATWQQASELDPAQVTKDPENRWLARQNRRRFDFEAGRDFLLQATGELDLTMGGHGVDIATRDDARRRTLYGFVERQNLPGLFRTFDFASPDTSSAQRFQTTVPQQALYFMNSPFALEQARRLARRPELLAAPDLEGRVARLYEILYQRAPEPGETAAAERFLARLQQDPEPSEPAVSERPAKPEGKANPESSTALAGAPLSAWERYAQVLLMSNEAVFVD
ncbi:MAG: PSD1 domain-containing protein [Verrucomicrobiales bacterium]|nr:PSD1 domain-containing protein [Verrucomicrobiales bacterium]